MRTLGVAVILALGLPLIAAAGGGVDSTFGGDGKIVSDFGASEDLQGIAVQADGKIVAVGSTMDLTTYQSRFVVARYWTDGSLDQAFGTGGKVLTAIGDDAVANAVAVQNDGKIVVAGNGQPGELPDYDFAVVRYNADGSPDDTFGTGGKVLTDFAGAIDSARAIVIQPDGKLVVAGRVRPAGLPATSPGDFALARYDATGALDTTFGNGGRVLTDFAGGSDDWAWGLALAPGGGLVAAGYRLNRPSFTGNVEIARYDADGDLDPSFGDGGKVLEESAGSTAAFDVVVQPDGGVVVAGSIETDLALMRYTTAGDLDSTFGTGGIAGTDFGLQSSAAYGLARQPDGKLVVAGEASPDAEVGPDSPSAFAVARFEAGGDLDETFHGGAIVTEIGADTFDSASDVAIQPDGRIVVGGFTAASGGIDDPADFALVRYVPTRGYTPEGSNVEVFPQDEDAQSPVRLTFSSVTASGETALSTASSGPEPPPTWLSGRPSVYYDVSTTAAYAGSIEVCIDHAGIDFADEPQLYHYVGAWNLVATYEYEDEPGVACGLVDSLSPFALFARDRTAPTNPTLSSASHVVGAWSNDATVHVLWSAAADNFSGVDGYSYGFGPNPVGVPDLSKDAEENASGATSQPMGNGDRYFHLRTVDNAGNWSQTVHLGPFRIDDTAPTNPTVRGASHVVGGVSTDATVEVAWSGAADALSGVDGFSFQWTKDAPAAPDTVKDAEESAAGATSMSLAPGTWYFNLRTGDNAGNWSGTTNLGPFVIVRPATLTKPKPKKVTLCHRGRTIKVRRSAVKKHRKHGDKLGRCRKRKKRH